MNIKVIIAIMSAREMLSPPGVQLLLMFALRNTLFSRAAYIPIEELKDLLKRTSQVEQSLSYGVSNTKDVLRQNALEDWIEQQRPRRRPPMMDMSFSTNHHMSPERRRTQISSPSQRHRQVSFHHKHILSRWL